jgi:hypothetical protein
MLQVSEGFDWFVVCCGVVLCLAVCVVGLGLLVKVVCGLVCAEGKFKCRGGCGKVFVCKFVLDRCGCVVGDDVAAVMCGAVVMWGAGCRCVVGDKVSAVMCGAVVMWGAGCGCVVGDDVAAVMCGAVVMWGAVCRCVCELK